MQGSLSSEPNHSVSGLRGRNLWALWAVMSAFGTYFCMYAFRKPFTSAGFESTVVSGTSFKSLLVTSQILGYTISKFIGIKVVSEMAPERRARMLLLLIGLAELSLVMFAVVPPPWNAVFMFLNGIPLGMVFGLVLGFLEGRRITEALSAGLCASFILADGATKSVGAWLLEKGVSEFWMPAAAGGLFVLPLCLCVSMLARTPVPSSADIAERSERVQMNRDDRWLLMRRFGPGLAMLVLMYLLVTILRSIRADFAREIWEGLGEPAAPATFTTSEMFVAFGVMAVNGGLVFVHNNRRAFFIALGTCLLGLILIAAALLGREMMGGMGAFPYMVLVGLGLYLPYVAVHTTIFERLLAMTRERGNVGFLMYLADSTGYLGYVGCMLARGALSQQGNFLPFFETVCWFTCGVSFVCVLLSGRYFGSHQTIRNTMFPAKHSGAEQSTVTTASTNDAATGWMTAMITTGLPPLHDRISADPWTPPHWPLSTTESPTTFSCSIWSCHLWNPRQVLIKVEGCTLCGSDIHSIGGRRSVPVPTVPGHEIVGHVLDWGADFAPSDVTGRSLKIWDRVASAVVANCGECFDCQRNLPQKCSNAVKYGHEAFRLGMELLGGLAKYCLLTTGTAIVRLPEDLPLEVICPASCATATIASALENHQVADRVVLVTGAGLLGLTAWAMASMRWAATIIAIDPQAERRARALEFGTTHAISPEEAPDLIPSVTDGYGADLGIELSGAATAFQLLLASQRMGGCLTLVGAVFPGDPVSMPMERIVRRNLTLQGIHNYAPRHLQQAVDFLTTARDRFPFREVVRHCYPLQDIKQAVAAAKMSCNVRVGVKPWTFQSHSLVSKNSTRATHSDMTTD